jgi:hypothetical protein
MSKRIHNLRINFEWEQINESNSRQLEKFEEISDSCYIEQN